MKKIVLSFIIILLVSFQVMAESNANLTFQNISIEAGKDAALYIELYNPNDEVSGVQCDLYLPEGITIKSDEDGEMIFQTAERVNSRKPHSLEWSLQPDGSVRILNYSATNQLFKGTSGSLIEVEVTADASIKSGNYDISLKNIVITHPDGTTVEPQDYVGKAIVKGKEPVKYNLVYYVDNAEYHSEQLEEGHKITPIAYPVKNGYTFSGWIGLPENLIMPAHDLDINGTFTKNKPLLQTPNLTLSDISVKAGKEAVINIEMNNPDDEIAGVQCDLYLPKGVTIKSDEDGEMIFQTADRINSRKPHSLEWSYQSDGSMRILNYSATNQLFKGTAGSLIEVTVAADASMIDGMYNVSLKNVVITHPDGTTIEPKDFIGTVSVEGRKMYRLTYLIDEKTYKTVNALEGQTVRNPSVVSKEGYTFSGWDKEITSMPAHNDTIRSSYVPNQYVVTFLNNDGTQIASSTLTFGSPLVAPAAPEKEGYTFKGWDKELPATVGASNATYKAVYEVNQYTLKFMDFDGTVLSTITQDYNTTVKTPASPTRTGYTFTRWDKTVPARMPASNLEFKAEYSINKYRVAFVVDGQTVSDIKDDYASDIVFPTTGKVGYTFSGWDKSDRTVPAHDITFTGSYLSNPHKLTFMVDGEMFYELNVEYGKTIPQIDAPQKEGYSFVKWDGLPTTMPEKDFSVTAVYSKMKFRLTFYDADGKNIISQTELYYGDAVSQPATSPVKQGYTFLGYGSVISTMPAHDVEYIAQYKINNHKLSLYNEDKTLFASYNVDYATVLSEAIEALPIKVGYDFSHWVDAPETMPDHDLTLTASFTRTTYDVDGVYYTPDINEANTALTGNVTVTGISQTGKVIMQRANSLRIKYAEMQTEARNILLPSSVTSPSGESYTVATIAKAAFSGSAITSITIPVTVTKIEEAAVSNCESLQSVIFLGDQSPEMESGAIEINEEVEVYVPSTAEETFTEKLNEQSSSELSVTKADMVTNFCINVFQAGDKEPTETSFYSFGDNVILTVPEKKYYDVVWTDKTSNLVSYTNPYVFSAVKDVDVEWAYRELPYLTGDVNEDGKVTLADLTALICKLNGGSPSVFHEKAADANKDGYMDALDVEVLRNMLLEKIK